MSFCVWKVYFPHLKFYRTSSGKSTFRAQNDTDSANFRYRANKKYHWFPHLIQNILFLHLNQFRGFITLL